MKTTPATPTRPGPRRVLVADDNQLRLTPRLLGGRRRAVQKARAA